MKGFVFGVVVLLLLSCEGAMGAANFTLAFYEGGTCEDYTFTVLPQENYCYIGPTIFFTEEPTSSPNKLFAAFKWDGAQKIFLSANVYTDNSGPKCNRIVGDLVVLDENECHSWGIWFSNMKFYSMKLFYSDD